MYGNVAGAQRARGDGAAMRAARARATAGSARTPTRTPPAERHAPARLHRSADGSSTGTALFSRVTPTYTSKSSLRWLHSTSRYLALVSFRTCLPRCAPLRARGYFPNILRESAREHCIRVRRLRRSVFTAPAPTLRLPQTARRLSEWTLRSIDWYIFMYSCDSNVSSFSRWSAAVGRAVTESIDRRCSFTAGATLTFFFTKFSRKTVCSLCRIYLYREEQF